MLRPVAGAWPEQILAVKKIQKYRWPEHYISGRSTAGALKKWPEHSRSGWAIWKRILLRRSREQKKDKRNDPVKFSRKLF